MPTARAPRVASAPCAPAAPPPAPKAPSRKRKPRRRKSYFLTGETRDEMIRKYERHGVVFTPQDLALKVPHLRKLAKERLAAMQPPDGPDAA